MGKKRVKGVVSSEDQEKLERERISQEIHRLFPSLIWFVERTTEQDLVTPRRPGTLSFFSQDNGVKMCIRDRSSGKVAFVWAYSLPEALLTAERRLAGGTLDWRPDKFA